MQKIKPQIHLLILGFAMVVSSSVIMIFLYKPSIAPSEYIEALHAPDVITRKCSNGSELYICRKAHILGRDGDILTSEGKLLLDTSVHSDSGIKNSEQMRYHHLLRKWCLPKEVKYPQTVAVIASGNSENYFDWLFNIITKLDTLKSSQLHYDLIYLPQLRFKFQKETLDFFGIEREKIIEGKPNSHLRVKKALVPKLPTSSLQISRRSIEFIRQHFTPKALDTPAPKKILISSRYCPEAKLINETELIQSLMHLGFVRVYMEDFSIQEQAWLYSQAQEIISVQHAGLSNLVFCQDDTQVMELRGPGQQNHTYAQIAAMLKLNYQTIYCQEKHSLKHKWLPGTRKKTQKLLFAPTEDILSLLHKQ